MSQGEPLIEHFFKNASDFLAVAGLDGKFRKVGAAFLKYYSEEELLRRPYLSFVPEDEVPRALEVLQRLGAGESVSNFELGFLTREGEVRRITWVCEPDPGGKLVYLIGRDMTDLTAQALTMMQHAKLVSLGEMSSGIAHEINNPLTVVVASLSLLERLKDNPQKFQARLNSAIRGAERIEVIVRGLRKFSKPTNGKIQVPENILGLLKEAFIFTDARAKRYGAKLDLEVPESLSVECDGVEIQQVFINLLNNALDAARNADQKWVKIVAFEEGREVVVQFIDSGPGVSLEVEPRLFQPFFTTKKIGEGTGLGLPTSKAILDQHGGSLRLNRKMPHTCFEVRFKKKLGEKAA